MGTASARRRGPALDISQFAHSAWKVCDGFAKASFTLSHRRPMAISRVGETSCYRSGPVRR